MNEDKRQEELNRNSEIINEFLKNDANRIRPFKLSNIAMFKTLEELSKSLASTVAWEPSRFLGGISVNVKINKGVEPEKIVALIKGYLTTHGSQIQFNIVDTQTLIEAQKNPDAYKDLIVRIGGYSDFFVTIPKSLQDELISRTANENI